MESWVQTLITGLGAAGGGSFFTWIFARKKTNAEAKGSEIDNVEKVIAIWRETAEKLKASNDELVKEVHSLRQDVDDLRAELSVMHRENTKFKNYLIKRGIDITVIHHEADN